MIFLLGYIPDRAYYFTVNRTIDLGHPRLEPGQLLPAGEPDAAVPGARRRGRAVGASRRRRSRCPAPRTDGAVVQSGTKILYIGGSDGTTPTDTTFVAKTSGAGNFDKWTRRARSCPQPRADAAVRLLRRQDLRRSAGIGADGKPTDTVYVLTPDATRPARSASGRRPRTRSSTSTLPEPRAGRRRSSPAPDGLFLVGGTTDGKTPVNTVWKSTFDKTGELAASGPPQAGTLYHAGRPTPSAAIVGDYLWVYGGTIGRRRRRRRSSAASSGPARERDDSSSGSASPAARPTCPSRGRTSPASRRTARSTLVGGSDGTTPQTDALLGGPDDDGNIPEWKHLAASDLPARRARRRRADRPRPERDPHRRRRRRTASSPARARANIAPQAPFFQLGLVGATVPALKIDGEIGQQLGYLNANTDRHRRTSSILADRRLGVRPQASRIAASGASAAAASTELRAARLSARRVAPARRARAPAGRPRRDPARRG